MWAVTVLPLHRCRHKGSCSSPAVTDLVTPVLLTCTGFLRLQFVHAVLLLFQILTDLFPFVNVNRLLVLFHLFLVAAVFFVPFVLLDISATKLGCLPAMPAQLAHMEINLGKPAVWAALWELILQILEVLVVLLAQQAHTVHWSVKHLARLAQLEPEAHQLDKLQFHLAQCARKEVTLSLVNPLVVHVRRDLSTRTSVNRFVHCVPLELTEQSQGPLQIVRACSARLGCPHSRDN